MFDQQPGRNAPDTTSLRPGSIAGPRNGMGTAALVLGIIGLVLALIIPIVGIVLGVLGLTFGLIGHRRQRDGVATNGTMSLIGAGLGALAIVLAIVVAFMVVDDDPTSETDTGLGQIAQQTLAR